MLHIKDFNSKEYKDINEIVFIIKYHILAIKNIISENNHNTLRDTWHGVQMYTPIWAYTVQALTASKCMSLDIAQYTWHGSLSKVKISPCYNNKSQYLKLKIQNNL